MVLLSSWKRNISRKVCFLLVDWSQMVYYFTKEERRCGVIAELCSYDEAYNIPDAKEIGWCVKCKCDKNCPVYKKLHIRTLKERDEEK